MNRNLRTILIVDDDLALLQMLSRKLQKKYRILTADSGSKAITILDDEAVDLMILDQTMPEMSGFDTYTEINRKFQYPPLAIMATAFGNLHLAIMFMKIKGAVDFIQKPIDYKVLELKIKRAFSIFDLQNELRTAEKKQREAEERINASLAEKEILLQEIQHRVKNNMNIISSLLNLQMDEAGDEKTRAVLQDSHNRIQTMAMIHDSLYLTDDLSFIDMQPYLSKLGENILKGYTTENKIRLLVEAENIKLGIRQASPLGLFFNELLTNSIKYAFPENGIGDASIRLKKLADGFELTYMDTGIGIPDDLFKRETNSLGLKLVRTLVEQQLNGSIDIQGQKGAKFIIKFMIASS